jgi:hypothetical protein
MQFSYLWTGILDVEGPSDFVYICDSLIQFPFFWKKYSNLYLGEKGKEKSA